MIKVMHVLTDTNIGGAGIWLINFLENYNRKEFDIVAVLAKNAAILPRIKELGVKTIELDGVGDISFSLPSVKSFVNIMKKEKPAIIHTHASLSARIAAKLCRIPVVHTRHCIEGKKSFPVNMVYSFINRTLSAHVTGVSKAVCDNLLADGIPQSRVSLIYNGITPLRDFSPEERIAARKKYSIPEDALVVGLVARLEQVKNPMLFVEAAKLTVKKIPNVFFVLCGDGSLRDKVTEAIRPIKDKVLMTGYTKDVETIYNTMDIFTLTSDSEALSIAIIEALSAGAAVITTRSGGPTEIIENGENGLTVPCNDKEALSDAIVQLAQSPEKRKAFIQKGKKLATEKFSALKMAEAIENIYTNLTSH